MNFKHQRTVPSFELGCKYSSKCTANAILLYKCVRGFFCFVFQSRAARYKYIRAIKSTSNAVGDKIFWRIHLPNLFLYLGQEMNGRIQQILYILLFCRCVSKNHLKDFIRLALLQGSVSLPYGSFCKNLWSLTRSVIEPEECLCKK